MELRSVVWLLAGVAALLLALIGGALLFVWLLMTGIRLAQFDWVATETGYTATEVSERVQEVCVCEAYACGGEAEPAHIAFEGWWRRSYAIIRDPLAGDDFNWGRKVVTTTRCVRKQEGDRIVFTLTVLATEEVAGLAGKARLRLGIE
jgi:hypothetical protein